jgi:hypothetical protein
MNNLQSQCVNKWKRIGNYSKITDNKETKQKQSGNRRE